MKTTILNYIAKDIEEKSKALGIDATFSVKVVKDYAKRELPKVVSTSFEMTPAIFDEIHIKGFVETFEEGGMTGVSVELMYCGTRSDGNTKINYKVVTYALPTESYRLDKVDNIKFVRG